MWGYYYPPSCWRSNYGTDGICVVRPKIRKSSLGGRKREGQSKDIDPTIGAAANRRPEIGLPSGNATLPGRSGSWPLLLAGELLAGFCW